MEVSLKRVEQLLHQADNIIITGHVNPDGDCLGSILALYHYLASIDKHVQIALDDDTPLSFQFLPGIDYVSKLSSSMQVDLLVVLDSSDLDRIGSVGNMANGPILNIDHHISNTKFADYLYLDSSAAATGEIIYELLAGINANISKDMATCLYTAIATDTGFFRYANTSSRTLKYAASLLEYGAKPHLIAEALETRPLSSITTLKKVLETLELYHNGMIASITLLPDILESTDTTDGYINYPRSIEGVELAIAFKSVDENTNRVSFRSKRLDVSNLALSFGGGGHSRAAGCTVYGQLDEVKDKVIMAAIERIRNTI